MAINHLLLNTMEIYYPMNTTDAVGGHSIGWVLEGLYPCRIEQLNQDREVIVGRDNTTATHRIYLNPDVYDRLDYNRRVKVGNKYFQIIDFEDLDPIISNSNVLHVELYVKWTEVDDTNVVVFQPAVIGTAIIG